MTDYVQKKIAPGVELLAVPAGRFKTNELAIHLAVPMEEQMAANYALAISAVSRKGKAYPDMRALHLQLDKLYGAAISVTANKSGGCQILKMGITTLDDRFALDDEKIAEAGLELLMNLLFDPLLGEDGLFSPADIETERRVLLEKLAAEENEKRLYAVMQMQQIMFAGDPYRINPKGTKETLLAATPEERNRRLAPHAAREQNAGNCGRQHGSGGGLCGAAPSVRGRGAGVSAHACSPFCGPVRTGERCTGRAKKFVKVSWCWAFVWICDRMIRWHRLCAAFAMCSAAAHTPNSL